MKRFVLALLLLLFFAVGNADESAALRVHDGDTFALADAKYRIWGVDAPELDQPWGIAAREVLRQLGDCNLDVEKLLRKLSVAGYDVERELAELAYLCATVNRCRHAAYEFMARLETMNHHAGQVADMSYNTTYRFGRDGIIGVPETVTA